MKLNTPEPNLIFYGYQGSKEKKDPRLKKVLTLMLTNASSSSGVPHALNGAFANICVGPAQEAALQLEWAGQNKDLSQASKFYKVSKNEFKR